MWPGRAVNDVTGAVSAIVGVGLTDLGECAGVSANEFAVQAAASALTDAGLERSAIDGLVTCRPPMATGGAGVDEEVGHLLGISPAFSSTLHYGAGAFSLQLAAMAIATGLASTVLVTFGTNLRSARASFAVPIGVDAGWAHMHGLVHIAGPAAMAMRRHMTLYGTTEEQLGWVSVAQREWAAHNPLAIFRTPLSITDYLDSPYVVAPLRRPDLTMISDGGAAIIVTTAERAADCAHSAVYQLGMAQQSALRGDLDHDRLMRPWLGELAARVYAAAGLGPDDLQAAYLQDATSVWVLQQLEAYGFCGVGESGAFVAEGHTRPGGRLPVNTNGGQLSESYMWNWTQLVEAVVQLRGEAGKRQVPGVESVLYAQTHDFVKGAASILGRCRP